jgi:hypothetical protein
MAVNTFITIDLLTKRIETIQQTPTDTLPPPPLGKMHAKVSNLTFETFNVTPREYYEYDSVQRKILVKTDTTPIDSKT